MRRLLKDLVPPVLVRALLGRSRIQFRGDYASWEAARAASTGYESDEILRRTREAALAVKRGEARMDRDGVAFDQVDFPFAVIASVLRAACARDGRVAVLDIGGGLGSCYRQFKAFGAGLRQLLWNVVELPNVVADGRAQFEDDELRFFGTLDESLSAGTPDVVILSSVLQYLPEPYALLEQLDGLLAGAVVVLDRTPCDDGERDLICVQSVPASIYRGRYPCRIFSRRALESALSKRRRLRASFSGPASDLRSDRGPFTLRGYVLDPQA